MAWGLLFSALVARTLDDRNSATTFQLLFLQSGLIAFMSSSAYARGAHLGADLERQAHALASYLKFVAVGSVVGVAVAVAVFPHTYSGGLIGMVQLAFWMSIGAAVTAANAFLQGIVTVREGRSRAFMPALVVSTAAAVCGVALIAVHSSSVWIGLWVASQLLTPVVLVLSSSSARSLVSSLNFKMRDTGNLFALTGAINAAFVVALYLFRDRWSALHPLTVSATALYVNRYAELVMQVVFMALASSPGWVNRRVEPFLRSRRGGAVLMVVALGAAVVPLAVAMVDPVASAWRFGLSEAAVVPVRCVSALCLVVLLGHRTTRSYVLAVLTSVAMVGALMLVPSFQSSLFGIQLVQVFASLGVAFVTMCVSQSVPRRQSSAGRHVLVRARER